MIRICRKLTTWESTISIKLNSRKKTLCFMIICRHQVNKIKSLQANLTIIFINKTMKMMKLYSMTTFKKKNFKLVIKFNIIKNIPKPRKKSYLPIKFMGLRVLLRFKHSENEKMKRDAWYFKKNKKTSIWNDMNIYNIYLY